jgi:hypothetical protein
MPKTQAASVAAHAAVEKELLASSMDFQGTFQPNPKVILINT